MLTTLGPAPVVLTMRHTQPVMNAKWIHTRPVRQGRTHRVRLSRGVWILREQHWLPTSALDSAVDVPEQDATPEYRRSFSPPDWMRDGLCTQLPPAESDVLFFGIEIREPPALLIAQANAARQICDICPVAVTCLTWALAKDERYGVWGGTSGRQREKLRIRLLAGAAVDDLVAELLPHVPLPELVLL